MKIKIEHEFIRALWRIDKLTKLTPEPGSKGFTELEELIAAVEEYDNVHCPIPESLIGV